MIFAIGLDVDPTFSHFLDQAERTGIAVEPINLRALVDGEWCLESPATGDAHLRVGEQHVVLTPQDAFFCRMIDLSAREIDPHRVHRWRSLSLALNGWLAGVQGRIVNRPNQNHHNGSKPLHEVILRRLGLLVPDSITSSNRDDLLEFVRESPAINKTICGIRADAARVSAVELDSFESDDGPIHLQRYVDGDDARIHVVGERVIAQRVSGGDADYRREMLFDDLRTFTPPPEIQGTLIRATKELGLAIAGWDFKIDDNDRYWCLEANPMPGYSPYDRRCDGAISKAILEFLCQSSTVQMSPACN